MKTESQIEDNLNETFPELSKAGNENCFVVPEDYFDSLSEKIMERCSNKKIRNVFVKKHIYKFKYVYSFAACLFVFILLYPFTHNYFNKTETQQTNYVDEYLLSSDGVDETALTEALSEDTNQNGTDVKEDYILDNDVDNNEFINEK